MSKIESNHSSLPKETKLRKFDVFLLPLHVKQYVIHGLISLKI